MAKTFYRKAGVFPLSYDDFACFSLEQSVIPSSTYIWDSPFSSILFYGCFTSTCTSTPFELFHIKVFLMMMIAKLSSNLPTLTQLKLKLSFVIWLSNHWLTKTRYCARGPSARRPIAQYDECQGRLSNRGPRVPGRSSTRGDWLPANSSSWNPT